MDVDGVYWHPSRKTALVVMSGADGHALVWLRFNRLDRPVPVEVALRAGDGPSERRSREMVREYAPPRYGSVSTSLLRALSLSDALNAVSQIDWRPNSLQARLAEVDPDLVDRAFEPFRSTRDRAAAIEWVNVAAAFVARVHAGDPAPAKSLAEDLGKSTAWVNKRLAAARTAGYLTSFGHGRQGGDLTEEGLALLQRVAEQGARVAPGDKSGARGRRRHVRSARRTPDRAGRVVMCLKCMTPFIHGGKEEECPECGRRLQ